MDNLLSVTFAPAITKTAVLTNEPVKPVLSKLSTKRKSMGNVMLVATPFLVTGTYLVYKYIKYKYEEQPVGNTLVSWITSKLMKWTKQPNVNTGAVRTMFQQMNPISLKDVDNHTHPRSAAVRSGSAATMDLIASNLGKRTYFVQESPSDIRKQREGCRTYYWVKDLGVEFNRFNPHPEDIICMVDVDMYITKLPVMLAKWNQVYMISTFQPAAVSISTGEYSFRFDVNNRVHYSVSGGAQYEHQLWNYSSDVLLSVSRGFLGVIVTIAAYNVDRRQISEHHQIICLTPIKTISCPFIDLSKWITGSVLRRLEVVQGDFTRLSVQKKDARYVSTGKVDTYAVATIPVSQDEAIATQARINTVKLSIAQVKSATDLSDLNSAAILTEYHSQKKTEISDCVYPMEQAVKNYQFEPHSFDPDAKHSVTPFMHPLMDDCYAPDSTAGNDRRAIMGRVVEIRNGPIPITPMLQLAMDEFIEMLIPNDKVGTGIPVSQDEMYLRQNRPSQRAILDRGFNSIDNVSTKPVASFVKAETYDEVKDPRSEGVV